MIKKIKLIFLVIFVLLLIPISVNGAIIGHSYGSPVSMAPYSPNGCDSSGSCFDGMGIEIKILKYDGSGNPQTQGHPVLIHQPSLFNTKIYSVNGGGLPGSWSDFVSTDNWPGYEEEPIPDGQMSNALNLYCYKDKASFSETVDRGTNMSPPAPINGGYAEYIYIYKTNKKIVTYSGVSGLGKYEGMVFSDSSLPSDYQGLNDYINSNKVMKYIDSISNIRKYFGVSINYAEIDEYYVSIEPVFRVRKIGGETVTGTFLARVLTEELAPAEDFPFELSDTYRCNCKTCEGDCIRYSPTTGRCIKREPSYSCNCDTCYKYTSEGSCSGEKDTRLFYGNYANGESYLVTARELYGGGQLSSSRLCRLQDSMSENAHCELEEDNVTCRRDSNGNIIYQYYIGPSLDKALVGTSSNNYLKFNSGKCNANLDYASGIKHFYLQDIISCKNVCNLASSDKTSDEYLRCAENYCDAEVDYDLKGNARIRKKDCILTCEYSYGKDPTPNDGINNSESINSCSNSSPYNNIEKNNIIVDTNSNCSIDKLTGDDLAKTNAVIANCIGDNVTDFDGDDTNDTIFDHRTYINVACKETSGFNFYDLTNRKFVAGQGIDYWGKLNGERECTVYFNLEQWKFDYATISSKDPDRRKRLLYIYNTYNNALDNNYNPMNDPNYDEIFAEDNAGEVDWESLEYNTSKVSITSKVTEIVNNVVEESLKYTLVSQSEDDSTNTTIVGKDTIKAIQNMNVTNRTVNRYVFTDNIKVMYTFDKYCVSLDGEASVYKAPENGICYVNTKGNNVWGRNVYYTNLNATRNKDFIESIRNQGLGHSITTDVSIGKEVANESPYYKDGESCPYEIDDDSLSCSIIIKSDEGTIMHGNDIYVYGGVTATLKVDERLGVEDEVENVGITTGITPSVNNIKNLNIEISDKKNGVESIYVTGIAESARGVTVKCQKLVHIIDPSDECGVSCSIKKDSDLVYEIVSPEIGNRTQIQTPKAYYTALSTNMSWKTVLKNISDDRYIVRLNRPIGNIYVGNMTQYDETIVYGKVEGTMKNTGEKCYNVCWSDPPELPNCTENYLPSDTSSIKEHCEVYWDKDINNYSSYEDCTNQCSKARMCPDDRRNYEEVEQVCRNNYQEWGYNKASSCINYCYYCPECSADYIYRQIQVYNPFPYSKDSNTLGFNYPTGNRIIPSNWVGKTDYIKQDDGDKTSVTGIYHHQNVEYVIELTRNEIDLIKEDTKKYNDSASGNNAYLDYVYVKGTDETKAYKSKFIHDNENTAIGNIFKVVNGEIVSK